MPFQSLISTQLDHALIIPILKHGMEEEKRLRDEHKSNGDDKAYMESVLRIRETQLWICLLRARRG
jgi:hypothetical protein